MDIYFLMLEGKPLPDNDESQEISGGFINCWVKAANPESAIQAAEDYASSEGWEVIRFEEIKIVNSENYNNPDAIECYREAQSSGLGAIIYTFESDLNQVKSSLS
ncbi:MAG: hypothetical protein WBL80_04060 [Erysipelotrichaceae bacterium]